MKFQLFIFVNMPHLVVFLFCALHFSEGSYDMPDFHLVINSSRNDTGHWISHVDFQHGDNRPWDLDVEHKTIMWKGKRSILIDAQIVAPVSEEGCSRTDYNKLQEKGYTLLPGFGYYKVHTERINWTNALEVCQQEGAHLLILNSDDEAHKVATFANINSFIGHDCWVGIHDMFREGHYVTIFNEPLSTTGFTKWDDAEPDSGPNENCFDFTYWSRDRYGLGDYECHHIDEFICEKELL